MRSIPLFTPAETHPCPYLDDLEAQSQYVDPRISPDIDTLSALSRLGFRRSGKLLYRPACPSCSECKSVRLPVGNFKASRNMKRLLSKTRHWRLSVQKPSRDDEFYELYARYITERHSDGDMYPPSRQTYAEFLTEDFGNTYFLLTEDQNGLIGVLVFDVFNDGLSAVYCFYAPERESESVGTNLIIRLTQLSTLLGLHFNYLGYLVEGCRKMEYKKRFKPLEVFEQNHWVTLNPDDSLP
ncbi:MAG: arginyltransferase [Pseudomonadota bacterium]|nr:arginyltransferase [Pseudomonadota bacterium]MEE2748748.1 arginyltransferase [Pseudomonadota bacterium]